MCKKKKMLYLLFSHICDKTIMYRQSYIHSIQFILYPM